MSIGVTAEVCHVDPTGSVHSTGMKTKNAPNTPKKSANKSAVGKNAQNTPKNVAKNKPAGDDKKSQKGKRIQDTDSDGKPNKKRKRNTKKGNSKGDDDDFVV